MTFGAPQFLFALAILPALMLFVRWAWLRRAAATQRIGDAVLIERLSKTSRPRHLLRITLWFLGTALIIVALARPQWGSDIEIVEQRGVQVVVVLDISRSMLAQDMKPTRLDRAKLEISDLISRLDGDEVGIVLFSGASFHPISADLRLRHRPHLSEPRQYERDHPPGHRHRRGNWDGAGRLQQSADESENHRHHDRWREPRG